MRRMPDGPGRGGGAGSGRPWLQLGCVCCGRLCGFWSVVFVRGRRALSRPLAAVVLVVLAAAAAAGEPVRILPLGDSITQGGRAETEYTYRWPLYKMLTDAGVAFDFIGSQDKGVRPAAEWPEYKGRAFDMDHEGHYGWTTGAVADKLAAWAEAWSAPPDIALVHLGTNDLRSEDYRKSVVAPVRRIAAILRRQNAEVVILLGHLNFNQGAALKVRPLVERLARELHTAKSPVVTVHHYQGWTADPAAKDTDTLDWAHPNLQGQRKMAEKWFAAMKPFLKE